MELFGVLFIEPLEQCNCYSKYSTDEQDAQEPSQVEFALVNCVVFPKEKMRFCFGGPGFDFVVWVGFEVFHEVYFLGVWVHDDVK